jgi:hypothetical protein
MIQSLFVVEIKIQATKIGVRVSKSSEFGLTSSVILPDTGLTNLTISGFKLG